MKLLFIVLMVLPALLLSQPDEYRKDRIFDEENSYNKGGKFANAMVKSRSIWMAAEFGKEKKYLYELNTYNISGNLIETRNYLPDGRNPYIYKFEYDNSGKLTKKIEEYKITDTSESIKTSIYKYDLSSRPVSINEYKQDNIKDSTLIEYDDAENSLTYSMFTKDTILLLSMKYYFDEKNMLKKAVSNNKDGKISSSVVTYYKDSLQVVDKEDDLVDKIEGITFDNNNHIIQKRYSIPGQASYIQYKAEYKKGIIVSEKINYNQEGYYLLEKSYDNNGNVTVEDYYQAKGKISQRRILKYNDKNLLIGIAEGDENIDYDSSLDKTIYEYEYYK